LEEFKATNITISKNFGNFNNFINLIVKEVKKVNNLRAANSRPLSSLFYEHKFRGSPKNPNLRPLAVAADIGRFAAGL
jgi:hypothetical protein